MKGAKKSFSWEITDQVYTEKILGDSEMTTSRVVLNTTQILGYNRNANQPICLYLETFLNIILKAETYFRRWRCHLLHQVAGRSIKTAKKQRSLLSSCNRDNFECLRITPRSKPNRKARDHTLLVFESRMKPLESKNCDSYSGRSGEGAEAFMDRSEK